MRSHEISKYLSEAAGSSESLPDHTQSKKSRLCPEVCVQQARMHNRQHVRLGGELTAGPDDSTLMRLLPLKASGRISRLT